jgi:hypothetical protein
MIKEIQTTIGYNHLEPGEPGNLKPYRICGSKTRNPATENEYCQRPAGWGTSHAGVGRCKLHGGSKMMKPSRYSKLWRGRMKDIATQVIEQDDTDPLDLLAELEVQRVLLSVLIDRLQPGAAPVILDESPASKAIREAILTPPAMSRNMKRKMMQEQESNTGVDGGVGNNDMEMVPVDNPLTEFSTSDDENKGADFHGTLVVPREGSVVPGTLELWDKIQELLRDITTTVTRITTQRNQTAITKAEVTWLVMTMKEGMEKFVPKENQEGYVRWMMDNIPGAKRKVEEGEGEI